MRNLIAAEWTKMLPHKGTWLLVWIYPILFFIVLSITIMVEPARTKPETVAGWIEDTSLVWQIAPITLGRYFIAAYFALVFAGEYGWNTWKLVVPHAARWKLIGAKYLVTLTLLYIAWIATALIAIALRYLGSALSGETIPAGLTFGAILSSHAKLAVLGIAPMLIAATYATAAAVLTRSNLAAFFIALVLVTLDELYARICMWLSTYGMEWPTLLYRVLPGYHLDNVYTWLQNGVAYKLKLATGTVISYPPATSVIAITVWVIGLAGLTFVAFRRQDIN